MYASNETLNVDVSDKETAGEKRHKTSSIL